MKIQEKIIIISCILLFILYIICLIIFIKLKNNENIYYLNKNKNIYYTNNSYINTNNTGIGEWELPINIINTDYNKLNKKWINTIKSNIIKKEKNIKIAVKNNTYRPYRLVVCLTTSPLRIPKIEVVLDNMLTQTLIPDAIYIFIPKVFKRTGETYDHTILDKYNKKSPVIKCTIVEDDLGPITKILPIVNYEKDPQTIAISIDDDVLYDANMLYEYYCKSLLYNDAIIINTDNFNSDVYPIIEGCRGITYRIYHVLYFFDEYYKNWKNLAESCDISDDFMLSNMVWFFNFRIYSGPFLLKRKALGYGLESDGLHTGVIIPEDISGMCNIYPRYINCAKFANKKKIPIFLSCKKVSINKKYKLQKSYKNIWDIPINIIQKNYKKIDDYWIHSIFYGISKRNKKIKYMVKNENYRPYRIVVCLSTSPVRLPNIEVVLDNMLTQTLIPDVIYVFIPKVYKKTGETYDQTIIDKYNNKSPIIKCIIIEEDLGPVTKILPVINYETNPRTIAVSIDDDITYHNNMLYKYYCKSLLYNDAIITTNISTINNNIIIEGYCGIAYKIYHILFFYKEFNNKYKKLPRCCTFPNDLIISNMIWYFNFRVFANLKNCVSVILPYGLKKNSVQKHIFYYNNLDNEKIYDNTGSYNECDLEIIKNNLLVNV